MLIFNLKQELISFLTLVCSVCILVDIFTIIADFDNDSVGGFNCHEFSSLLILLEAFLDVSSHTIDLACNISGTGDVELSPSSDNGIAMGGDVNNYEFIDYHMSNDELVHVRSTGSVTLGSGSKSVSNIVVDGAVLSLNAQQLTLVSSSGSVAFSNVTSSLALGSNSAQITINSKTNISINAQLTVSLTGGGSPQLTLIADSDCSVSDGDHLSISSPMVVDCTSYSTVTVSSPAINIENVVNVTYADLLKLEGKFCFICVSPMD